MSKRFLIIMTVLVALAVLAVCVGCESYKYDADLSMGDKDEVVYSNGGTVVKQGSYIYFINGYADYKTTDAKANWFGNVVKGAIMRIKADATDMSTAEIVVPKSVLSDSKNTGFSIYGDYIYYVSPSAEEDKSGTVQTSTLQFLRTRLDGQETRLLYELNNRSVDYIYTPNALVIYKDNTIYSKSYDAKRFKKNDAGTVLAEDVTSVHFPQYGTYNPKTKESYLNYFFYTKAEDGNQVYSNRVYVCNGTGSVNKVIIDRNTYTDAPDNLANNDKVFSLALTASFVDDNGITLYYSKTVYHGSTAGNVGFYGYKFTAADFESDAFKNGSYKLDATREYWFANSAPTSIFAMSLEDGYVNYTSGISYVKLDEVKLATCVFSATSDDVTATKIISYDKALGYLYFLSKDNYLVRKSINGVKDNIVIILDKAINSTYTYICPELLDGNMYFILSDDSYLYRVSIADYDRINGAAKPVLVGRIA